MRAGDEGYPAVVVLETGSSPRVISGVPSSEEGALVLLRHQGRTVRVRHAAPGWDSVDLWAEEDLSRHSPCQNSLEGSPPVTIAICTLGTHPRLRASVEACLAQTYPNVKVLVVDNDPRSSAARKALGDLAGHVTIVDEPSRGLSFARNAAISAVASGILAFTDDDAIVEPSWATMLMELFLQYPRVAAVTGLVMPAELRTPAQRAFEEYVGFGKGLARSFWTLDSREEESLPGGPGQTGVLFPFTTGKVGSGNNMAFRVEALREVGGFDVALGAGSIARGAEDLDIFTQLLLKGKSIVYTPDAVVWHYHRESMAELFDQIYANGIGMGALVAKAVAERPSVLGTVARRLPAVARRALLSRGRAAEEWGSSRIPPGLRRRLLMAEMRGLSRGPLKYLRSRVRRT